MKGVTTTSGLVVKQPATIAWRVWGVSCAALVVSAGLAFAEPENDPLVTAVFYGGIAAFLGVIAAFLRAQRVGLAGWLLSAMFLLATVAATLVNGTVAGATHTTYFVSILISAAILGRRAAMLFTVLSVVAVSALTLAELRGALPEAITGATAQNAWVSVTIPLAFAAYLLHVSLREREKMVETVLRRGEERDRAQAKLVEAQKMEVVGRLAAGIAHDFNNLLTVIVGSTDLMRMKGELDPELLANVEDATRRASLLTSRVLTFAKPDAERRPQRIDPAVHLTELGPLLQRLVGDELRIGVDVQPAGMIEVDPVAFEQVIVNLVVNAKEAIDGSGTVEIGLARDKEQLVVTVSDTGPGVPKEQREAIFEPFHTTKETGTGLGLATVRSLVRGAGGAVEVDASGTGGALFRLRFPRHVHAAAMESVDEPSLAGPSGLRLLLVEDDELVREATVEVLGARGWMVAAAGDGLEALSRLKGDTFDVVVTDNHMHGMSGLELARRVRDRGWEVPILLVSGNPVEERLPPRTSYLPKPYGHEGLIAAIATLLGDEASAPACVDGR